MKLSASQIRRFTSVALNLGDSFGLYDDVLLPQFAHHYWTSHFVIDDEIVAYSLFIDDNFFYFTFNSNIVACKRYLHYSLGIEEMALFCFLVFCKHQSFNL